VGILVAGIIIGLLGKLVAPRGRDDIPLWLTLLCGVGGVLLGLVVYRAFGGNGSPGIDWTRWIVSVLVSAVLVVVASSLTGRNRRPGLLPRRRGILHRRRGILPR